MLPRPCLFEWCKQPAKVLPNKMKFATKEPFFCSYKHAAFWALIHIGNEEFWCEKGQHYTAVDPCFTHASEEQIEEAAKKELENE